MVLRTPTFDKAKLLALEPQFVRVTHEGHRDVHTLQEAQGLRFLCPLGHGHYMLVWFRDRGVLDSETPGPMRWDVSGTGYGDLTLSTSVWLRGCSWVGFVLGGEVTSV